MPTTLEGWLALADEARAMDRLSGSYGLDIGTSRRSRTRDAGALNASANAFRFLPVLHDISPKLLHGNAKQFEELPATADLHSLPTSSSASTRSPSISPAAPTRQPAPESISTPVPIPRPQPHDSEMSYYRPNEYPTGRFPAVPVKQEPMDDWSGQLYTMDIDSYPTGRYPAVKEDPDDGSWMSQWVAHEGYRDLSARRGGTTSRTR